MEPFLRRSSGSDVGYRHEDTAERSTINLVIENVDGNKFSVLVDSLCSNCNRKWLKLKGINTNGDKYTKDKVDLASLLPLFSRF